MPPNEKKPRDSDRSAEPTASLRMRSPGRSPRPRSGTGVPLLKEPSPQYLSPAIETFRGALVARNTSNAMLAWGKTTAADREGYASYSGLNADLALMLSVIGTQTIGVMKALKVDFDGRSSLAASILDTVGGQWVDALVNGGAAMWHSFLRTMPDKTKITEKQAKAWGRFVYAANSKQGAKAAFERVYPTLRDDSYDPDKLEVAPWDAPDIHRLYRALSKHVVVAHVQMAKDFSLGTRYNSQPLEAAFWQKSGGHIVIPKADAKVKGSNTKRPESMRRPEFFERAALHEVGHAVGDHQGGHEWAMNHMDWQMHGLEPWSENLWGSDNATHIRAMARVRPGETVLPAEHARLYMAYGIAGHRYSIPIQAFADVDAIEAACIKQYGDQKLTKYWQHVRKADNPLYQFPDKNNYQSGRVWVFTKAWGCSSYKQKYHADKVSWYSLRSYKEWFAENYVAYYNSSPKGSRNAPATKAKIAQLQADKERRDNTDRTSSPTAERTSNAGPPPHRLPFSF